MDIEFKNPGVLEQFRVGERWYSYDNGLTWSRQQARQPVEWKPDSPHVMVTKIDRERGEITLSGAWTDATGTYPPQAKR